ncbi:MAG TPA: phosphatase PAP2 family protein [Chitinophagaceae bacterium]|nr:phosphatase PAP2 family protein [Chitinophagaceae bacterium]
MNELAVNFWHRLIEWDQYLFQLINGKGANSFFDAVMPFLRNSSVWAPLYLFLLVFILINFRLKGLWWAVFFLSTVALTDMTGTYIFKHNIERYRPCSDPDFYMHVRLVINQCAGGYSFISNHAANHFGMAVFFLLTMKKNIGNWAWIGIFWAAAIAYAQVYVGVHYPLDVLAGALVGIFIGTLTASLFNKRFRFAIFDDQPTL